MQFSLTVVNVLIMMAYAVPGYLLMKFKMVKSGHIPSFAIVLLYVCQPCLALYSYTKAEFSLSLLKDMGIFLAVTLVLQALVIFVLYFIFRKKYEDPGYRVLTLAGVFGNIGYLGVPLLEAFLPEYPNALALSSMYILTMNLLSWTIGCALMTGDKGFISVKRIILNPPILTLVLALPLFFTNTQLPDVLDGAVTLLGRMTLPLCMIILGMRLATADIRELLSDWKAYLAAGIKLIAVPFIGFAMIYFLPVEHYVKVTMFILCCCPTASVVLSFAELNDTGQKTAANMLLFSTILSMATIPLLLLLM